MTDAVRVLSGEFTDGVPALELVQAIDGIRAQLSRAVEQAEGHRLQFELGDVELEFTVSITQDSKAEGGIRVWVLNIGGSAGESVAGTQRLKITLKPKDTMTDRSPQVSDHTEQLPPR
jgi:hypothetical protein